MRSFRILTLCLLIFSCVQITFSHTLFTWGFNNMGKLGDGTTRDRYVPTQIGNTNDWISVSTGNNHSVALKSDGTLWSWGWNYYGQLGVEITRGNTEIPIQVGTSSDWKNITTSGDHSLAIKKDGTLWSWGKNNYGQLGDGTLINKNKPVQIGNSNNWLLVSTSYDRSFGIKSDGSLWGWGQAYVGDGTNISKSSPVRIGLDNDWTFICGGAHNLALKRDGTLWTWGSNFYGELGIGNKMYSMSPIKIGNSSDWKAVASGAFHSLALKNDGTLWAWGLNNWGQLGDGTTIDKLSPIQIGTSTDWEQIAGEILGSRAIKKDGTLWAWGYNASGQLGDGTTIHKSSPIQIGNSNKWIFITAGVYYTAGLQIFDNVPPTTFCKNESVNLLNNSANITPQMIDDGSYDEGSGIASLSLDKTNFTCNNIGDNPVTLTATDNNGNSATCQATVTVVGSIPSPSIIVFPEYTVNPGGLPHTIYLGYGPQSVTLSASGGVSYIWTSSPAGFTASGENVVVSPTVPTTYFVEATNEYGCKATTQIFINVINVTNTTTPGNGNNTISLCHYVGGKYKTLNVAAKAVEALLKQGATLGPCPQNAPQPNNSGNISYDLVLEQNYPNPFDSKTKIEYSLPEKGNVQLNLFDNFGREVMILENGQKGAGQHTVEFDNCCLASGTYFYKLDFNGQTLIKQMKIIK